MSTLWIILGASSAMARAFARVQAAKGVHLALTGRDADDLSRVADDLTVRGAASIELFDVDLRNPDSFAAVLEHAKAHNGPVSVAVFAGSMPTQTEVEADPSLMHDMVADNYTGAAEFLLQIAPLMGERPGSEVVGVSSVAGDRGRVGNYVYGSTKAAFQTFLSGHRNRMGREGVHVMTVKPGFVDTAMTWGLDGMFLVASPDDVARDIDRGLARKRNVIYTPWFWIIIMTIIRTIPERIFKKLSV